MELVKKLTVGKETIKIYQGDEHIQSPRTWDNLSQMVFFGNHKHLGDNHDIILPDYIDSRENFILVATQIISRKLNVGYIKAVNMYKHSGTSISTDSGYPFNCKWDSGTIGFVVVTKEAIRENWGIKNVTKTYREKAEVIAETEVETLNSWINGDILGFRIEDEDENEIDSCWGFYGTDLSTNGIADHIDEKFYEGLEIEVGG